MLLLQLVLLTQTCLASSLLWWLRGCERVQPSEDFVYTPHAGGFLGKVECRHRRFLGIPYAQPPVGPLRWKPPQPLPPPTAHGPARVVREYGAHCIQLTSWSSNYPRNLDLLFYLDPAKESEDCLTLNVYTPRRSKAGQLLPVILFIHGGMFSTGSASMPIYDGAGWMEAQEDFVLVTINYRLGLFGFLASREMYNSSGGGRRRKIFHQKSKKLNGNGNFGLQDQIEALRWTHRNIVGFGGDPQRITLMGQSAGSISAQYIEQILRDDAQPMILRSLVLMGGTLFTLPPRTLHPEDIAQRSFNILTRQFGCAGGGDDDEKVIVECLRRVEWQRLNDFAIGKTWDYLWGPIAEGNLISESDCSSDCKESNDCKESKNCEESKNCSDCSDCSDKSPKLPTLFTTTADEGSFFAANLLGRGTRLVEAMGRLIQDKSMIRTILQTYVDGKGGGDLKEDFRAMNAIITDSHFHCPIRRMLLLVSSKDKKDSSQHFFYKMFRKKIPILASLCRFLLGFDLGVMHGSDLMLLFRPSKLLLYPLLDDAKAFQQGISHFIHTDRYTEDVQDREELVSGRIGKRCEMIWDRVGRIAMPLHWYSDLDSPPQGSSSEKKAQRIQAALQELLIND